MVWRDRFEIELAGALVGGPVSVWPGFGPRTDAALLDLAMCWPVLDVHAVRRARRAFHEEAGPACDTTGDHRWVRELFAHAATAVTAARMSWCSHHHAGGETEDTPQRQLRRTVMQRWKQLDWGISELVEATLTEQGTQVAALRATRPSTSQFSWHHARTMTAEQLMQISSDDLTAVMLSNLTSRDRPTAVFTSAPVTTWPSGGAIIDACILRGFHPSWWPASDCDDTTAKAAVTADVESWMAMAIDHVVDHRADVVVSVVSISDAQANESELRLTRAGYRIKHKPSRPPDVVTQLIAMIMARCNSGDWWTPFAVAGRPASEQAAEHDADPDSC